MKKLKIFCLLFFSIFIISPCLGSLVVHFIDVGEGDSILIQISDNKNILVDTGNLSYGHIVKKYLKKRKISHLECIIITHMHADHIGGIFNILPQIKTEQIYYNGYHPQNNHFFYELLNLVKNLNIPLNILRAENHLLFGKVRFDVISPIEPLSGNMNEDSIVLRINFRKINILLSGDLNIQGEKRLINASTNLNSDILKVGHHGAEDSCSEEFINKVKPKIAVLSVGRDNRYGYPSNAVIERFKIKKIPLYRTDHDGTIIIHTDGNTISIKRERD